jgi:hypothetical protein
MTTRKPLSSSLPSARRLPLAFAAVALSLALAPAAWAQTKVDERRPATAGGAVEVENIAGKIEIRGGGKDVAITGTLHKDVERVDISQSGKLTRIKVIYPQRMRNSHGYADLVITVPSDYEVEAQTVSANLGVSGISGVLRLESVSGNVTVEGSPESAELTTVSGNVEANLDSARVEVETVSGSSELRGQVRQAELTTVSGNGEASLDGAERVTLESVSGTVRWSGTLAARGQLRAESFSGTVDVTLGSTDATVRASSFSGAIKNELGVGTVEKEEHGPGASFEATLGRGDARVELESFSGTVRIRR